MSRSEQSEGARGPLSRAGIAALATVLTVLLAPAAARAEPSAGSRLTLPAPTGPHPVGTVSMHLVDKSRSDPWIPTRPYRELMVSVWYPARDADRYPIAPYLLKGAADGLATDVATWGTGSPVLPKGSVDFSTVRAHGRTGAPVELRGGRRPVVLFSPGHFAPRALNTTLVEDLASHGSVVVTIDHTYESDVDFPPSATHPGGRVEKRQVKLPASEAEVVEFNRTTIAARVADTRTVLDRLHVLASGRNPDAGERRLPAGLADALDLTRVGMFGHSGGGATTAEAMYYDNRIKAGVVVDSHLGYGMGVSGPVLPPVATDGLDRPVLLFSSSGFNLTHREPADPSIASFWAHQRAWKRDLQLQKAKHISFADYESLLPQIVASGVAKLPPDTTPEQYLWGQIGTLSPGEAVGTSRAYLRAFFDLHLRHRPTGLFDRPSPRYPAADLIP
ncbi:alpha/beta hydrolase family protein [Amycolatopsis sp. cmx-11-12]|uniref:alpha/beta hydrolase family protein n=1 Tax=Amycolatopsis sp. cmx-11-12 TaxID=2785795 RepID=UPI0039182BB8